MYQFQNLKSFKHFARHLFSASKIHFERKKAEEEVYGHLQKMRKSILRMSLSYTDVDKLKRKIQNLIDWERKYSRFFKPEDSELKELRNQINYLEGQLRKEREEKMNIVNENNEKIMQLTESLNNVKNQMKHLHMEKARRHQRLRALESKIREKVNLDEYFKS